MKKRKLGALEVPAIGFGCMVLPGFELLGQSNRQSGLDVEQRLSRLAGWVLHAEREGYAYGLLLPGRTLKPAHGPPHRDECLKALAL